MKIGLFLIFALFFLGCSKKDPEITLTAGATGGSSVHYVDLDSLSLKNYYLSIDDDKANDFYFSYSYITYAPYSYSFEFSVNTLNQINKTDQSHAVYICVDKNGYPLELHKGDKIDNNLYWSNNVNYLFRHGVTYLPGTPYNGTVGNWCSSDFGYLGFKILRQSNTIWGWIQIGGITSEQYFIKDYAFFQY